MLTKGNTNFFMAGDALYNAGNKRIVLWLIKLFIVVCVMHVGNGRSQAPLAVVFQVSQITLDQFSQLLPVRNC